MLSLDILYKIMIILFFVDIFFFSYLIYKKLYMKNYRKKENHFKNLVGNGFKNIPTDYKIKNKVHLMQLIEHIKIIKLNSEEREKITHIFINNKIHKKYIKKLNSK